VTGKNFLAKISQVREARDSSPGSRGKKRSSGGAENAQKKSGNGKTRARPIELKHIPSRAKKSAKKNARR
jgi:hypothetical protein